VVQSSNLIRIDLDSLTPVYRQISDAIRAQLVTGTLAPGDLLPPVRQLAIDLTVHFNTVAEAYRTLAEEGWLDLRRRRGAQVLNRRTPKNSSQQSETKFLQRLQEFVAATQSAGLPPRTIAQHLRSIAAGLEQC
jgi:GntR family transcriptional regulator